MTPQDLAISKSGQVNQWDATLRGFKLDPNTSLETRLQWKAELSPTSTPPMEGWESPDCAKMCQAWHVRELFIFVDWLLCHAGTKRILLNMVDPRNHQNPLDSLVKDTSSEMLRKGTTTPPKGLNQHQEFEVPILEKHPFSTQLLQLNELCNWLLHQIVHQILIKVLNRIKLDQVNGDFHGFSTLGNTLEVSAGHEATHKSIQIIHLIVGFSIINHQFWGSHFRTNPVVRQGNTCHVKNLDLMVARQCH